MRSRLSPRERRPVPAHHATGSPARGAAAPHPWSSRVSVIDMRPVCVCRTLMRMIYANRTPGRKWLAPALAVIVVGFLAFSLPPYFTGGTRVPATFALHYPLLVGHVMFASVAMVAAVAQIWPRLRVRHPVLHRRVGRVYVYTAIPAAVCAMVDRGGDAVRPVPGRQQCLPGVAVAVVHDQRLPRRASAALCRPSAPHGPQRRACAVDHHQPDLDAGAVHLRCTRCRTASLAVTGSTSCGSRPASAPGWAGRFRCWPCSGGCTADQ